MQYDWKITRSDCTLFYRASTLLEAAARAYEEAIQHAASHGAVPEVSAIERYWR